MIFISSSCIKTKYIKEAIEILNKSGFKNIELTAGTEYYDRIEEDLISLQRDYELNFVCHNYFPPPKEEFVINLASLNQEIYERSLVHLLKAIDISKKLKAGKFGFHAGFYVDMGLAELGKTLRGDKLFNKEKALERFCEGYNILKKAAGGIKLYIENNFLSYRNYNLYKGIPPFMLTNYEDYSELRKYIDFNLLLDIGHLKVTTNTLNIDFWVEFQKLYKISDYIHLSDNDGLHDQNRHLDNNNSVMDVIKAGCDTGLNKKMLVLEIYEDLEKIRKTYLLLS